MALQQLAAWQEVARQKIPELKIVTEVHGRCPISGCGQSVVPLEFDGGQWVYTADEILALKVAHLRQAHMDLDPDR